tara:strand:- start:220 stop:543 length:324 start_codon:yes stop_codon:yes gene_type:complete
MEFEQSFGETIKKLREGRKLTLREVADELGIDTSMLGKIEKNNRKPSKELIEKAAILFEVSAKDLTVSFLSDSVVYQIMENEEVAQETLKVAEQKFRYLKTLKNSDK